MGYRYGGKISSKTKKRLAKGILCSLLALSVFSGMNTASAWRIFYIYHLPSGDPGTVINAEDSKKFDWNKVKDTVAAGLSRYSKEDPGEEPSHKGNYFVDEGYANDGKDYNWESYYYDWSGEGLEKVTISYFNFDTIGGTLKTHRMYGEGDWVTSRPPGWPYGDDFAMYSSLFDSTIPIRDMQVRSDWKLIQMDMENEMPEGSPNGIIPNLETLSGTTSSRAKESAKRGIEGFNMQELLSMAGNMKDLFAKIRDPKQLLKNSGLQIAIEGKETAINPKAWVSVGSDGKIGLDVYFGHGRGYSQKEMEEDSHGTIMNEKYEHFDKTNKEASEAYEQASKDLEEMQKDLQKLMSSKDKSGQESVVAAKERDESVRRLQMAIEKQKQTMVDIENSRTATERAVHESRDAIQRQYTQNQMHMPTAKEFAKEMREKREKYSTSRDLGFKRFGSAKKADFSKVLDNAINPKLGKDEESEGKQEG